LRPVAKILLVAYMTSMGVRLAALTNSIVQACRNLLRP